MKSNKKHNLVLHSNKWKPEQNLNPNCDENIIYKRPLCIIPLQWKMFRISVFAKMLEQKWIRRKKKLKH